MSKSGDLKALGVQFVDVSEEYAGQRIDNFLLARLKGIPKSYVYRILRKGEVRVNKGRIGPEYRLKTGDQVRVPPYRPAKMEPGQVIVPGGATKRIEDAILYEDNHLIAMDKPSGMAVHGGSGLSFGVIEALRANRPSHTRLELVHRLDRETSGCLLVAKKTSTLRRLHEAMRGDGLRKTYLLLVKGHWVGGSRLVDAPLKKNTLQSGERMVRVDSAGKPSQTEFRLVTQFADCALLEANLKTGRTHQIRVHAASIGHPIAGDDKYGDEQFNRMMKARGLNRLFLHAASLVGESELVPGLHAISAPLPDDLKLVLDKMT